MVRYGSTPSRCTLAKATNQQHERVSARRWAACVGPSALKVRSFWMDYMVLAGHGFIINLASESFVVSYS